MRNSRYFRGDSTPYLYAVVGTSFLFLQGLACAQLPPSLFDPTLIDDSPAAPAVRTHHDGVFNGQNLKFDVITGETILLGEDEKPASTIFSTAYIRSDVTDVVARPILFLFNGGPGASSSPLHLGIGPIRRPPSDNAGALVPNEHSVLDAIDMVFVDPAGTGYTRLYKDGAGEAFWGIEEDADAILFFMNDWLQKQGRANSPVFLMGESYGATRAVTLLARSKDVRFSGALLLSPALDFTAGTPIVGNNLPYIFLLPSMAATAAYHDVTDRGERTIQEVFELAATFSQSDYAAALYQGAALDDAERQGIAAEMARLTGLPEDYLVEQNLRINRAKFADALLADQGLRTGGLDARITGAIADFEGKRPPLNDPSMSGSGRGGRSTRNLLDEYFKEKLKTNIDRPYRSLNLDLNSKWNYEQKDAPRFYLTVVPLLEQAMKSNADLRIFVGGGVFDLVTPIMAARYATSQTDVSWNRFTYATYAAGHTVFDQEESRVKLGHDVRAFIASTLNTVSDTN
jgi:carboxypeptidase C (cathepsin A)